MSVTIYNLKSLSPYLSMTDHVLGLTILTEPRSTLGKKDITKAR